MEDAEEQERRFIEQVRYVRAWKDHAARVGWSQDELAAAISQNYAPPPSPITKRFIEFAVAWISILFLLRSLPLSSYLGWAAEAGAALAIIIVFSLCDWIGRLRDRWAQLEYGTFRKRSIFWRRSSPGVKRNC